MNKDEKKPEPPKNLLEKLIRLDKKNSNFNIQDLELKKKLKIRNNPNFKTPFFSTHLHDHGLKHFWKHVCNYYFRKIEQTELERLEYLELMLSKPLKDQTRKYAHWRSYLCIKGIFSFGVKHPFPSDPQLSKLNYQNLLKQFYLSEKLSVLTNPDIEEKYINDSEYIIKHKIHRAPKNTPLKEYLQEEEEKLDQLMDVIMKDEESLNESDEITREIDTLTEEMAELNRTNLKKLRKLAEIVKIENNSGSLCYIRTEEKPKLRKQEMVLFQQKQMVENNSQKDLLLKYLKHSILKLEQKQLAESVEQITACRKVKNGQNFEVFFEQNLTGKSSLLTEDTLCSLDKLRENSLFIYYNIPQKGLFSFTSQNFIGFENIQEKNSKNITLHRNKSLLPLMRKKVSDPIDESILNPPEKHPDFAMCHHCKCFFHQKNLIRCNYRSSLMGTPIVNRNHSDPMLYNENLLKGKDYKKRGLSNSRKRNNYCNYYKKNGEFFCVRQYCRICLKQNYDFNLQEISTKTDWICPFCQAVCFCTRCLRNNLITKLKGMFIFYGGSLLDISKDSPFEKHVKICEDLPFLKEKTHGSSNKTTPNEKNSSSKATFSKEALSQLKLRMREYKRKFKEFLKIKSLRTNMEKLRLISSQIIRREKLKLRLALYEQEQFFKSSELSHSLLKHPKNLGNHSKVQSEPTKQRTFRLMKKSIRKRRFTKKPKNSALRIAPIPMMKRRGRPPSADKNFIVPEPEPVINLKETPKRVRSRERNKAKKNRWLKLIRKTTNSILPEISHRQNKENPNEPSDNFEPTRQKPRKTLKCELKSLVKTQTARELSHFMEITKKSLINKKLLRSRNVKGKLRSNKMYRFQA